MRILRTTLLGITMAFAGGVDAGTIDFESVPGDTPSEGLSISTQYESTEGVSFALEGGGFPVLAEVGSPTTAFSPTDTPQADAGIGSFFLTDDGVLDSSLVSPALLIAYSTPTAAASGVILDIDYDESFVIQALDGGGILLETVTINAGDPGTGSRHATFWGFDRAQADIASLHLQGSRTQSGGFGLGFDLFNTRSYGPPTLPPAIVPLPPAWQAGLALLAGLGLIGVIRRRYITT